MHNPSMNDVNAAMARLGLSEHWSAEMLELHASIDGQPILYPITAFIHRDRGIGFGHAESFDGKDDPTGLFITDIFHVPSRKRLLTVAARLDDASSIALIVASLTRWQDHEDAAALLRTNKYLRWALTALIKKEFTLVISGSPDEERLHKLASAMADASQRPAGNA
jgi:hypothetical protein